LNGIAHAAAEATEATAAKTAEAATAASTATITARSGLDSHRSRSLQQSRARVTLEEFGITGIAAQRGGF
jgi:hypothetical protein